MSKNLPIDDFIEPSDNPLSRYFRIPGLHIKLPSKGSFMPEGSIVFETMTDELPVSPMTAADEMLLKSPDALLSGYAIEKLIESCVPSIKNIRQLASADVEFILLAIRAATYGSTMEINVSCPSCQHENEFDVPLEPIFESVQSLEDEYSIRLSDDIVVYIRPYNFENTTKATLATFQEAKKLQAIMDETEKTLQTNKSFERITRITIELTADCILKVVTPSGVVTNKKHIREFVDNVSKSWIEKIENKLSEINKLTIDKSQKVSCIKCKHEWKTEVEFNPSSFFGINF